jgi:N-acetylmuramoyl-L-alanine amidase
VLKVLIFIFSLVLLGCGGEVEARITPPQGDNLSRNRLSTIECLAVNAYHEARGESDLANLVIMSVISNRVKDDRFKAKTICKAVFKKFAFSWTSDGLSDKIKNRKQYVRLYRLSEKFLINRKLYENLLPSADHYHSLSIRPSWSTSSELVYLETIGNHRFYHWKESVVE